MTSTPLQGASAPSELASLAHALGRGKWIVLATVVIVVVLALGLTLLQDPEYEAYSVVLVDAGEIQAETPTGAVDTQDRNGTPEDRRFYNQLVILRKSLPIAEQVADSLIEAGTIPDSSASLPILMDEEGIARSRLQIAVSLLDSRVTFTAVDNRPSLVQITAVSPDPSEARLIANMYADVYQAWAQENSRASVVATRAFLEQQVDRRSDALGSVEQDLEAFMEQERVVVVEKEADFLVEQIASLESRLDDARLELATAESELASHESESARVSEALASRISSAPENRIRILQDRIADYEERISEFYVRYPALQADAGAERPSDLRQLEGLRDRARAELEALSALYVNEVVQAGLATVEPGSSELEYVAGLSRTIAAKRVAQASVSSRIDVLGRRLANYRARLSRMPANMIRLSQLERQRRSVEHSYLGLADQLQQARVMEQATLGYVSIVRRALKPNKPARPDPVLNLAVAFFASLLLGTGLALLRHAMNRRLQTIQAVRGFGLPVIGTVPEFEEGSWLTPVVRRNRRRSHRKDHPLPSLVALHSPFSAASESFRALHTNLVFSDPDRRLKSVVVTSALASEGKSTVAANLAVTAARGGSRVLLIDADLRSPSQHEVFAVSLEPGLSTLLFSQGPADWTPFRTEIENLYVVAAGRSAASPPELIGSQRMKAILEAAIADFDEVIVDTPPALLATESVVLGTECDATILVVSLDQSPDIAVAEAIATLSNVGVKPVGLVANRITPDASSYGYGYGYGYGQQYGRPGSERGA